VVFLLDVAGVKESEVIKKGRTFLCDLPLRLHSVLTKREGGANRHYCFRSDFFTPAFDPPQFLNARIKHINNELKGKLSTNFIGSQA
jgi:hypothetical protein